MLEELDNLWQDLSDKLRGEIATRHVVNCPSLDKKKSLM
jgi:hypothetical protein